MAKCNNQFKHLNVH